MHVNPLSPNMQQPVHSNLQGMTAQLKCSCHSSVQSPFLTTMQRHVDPMDTIQPQLPYLMLKGDNLCCVPHFRMLLGAFLCCYSISHQEQHNQCTLHHSCHVFHFSLYTAHWMSSMFNHRLSRSSSDLFKPNTNGQCGLLCRSIQVRPTFIPELGVREEAEMMIPINDLWESPIKFSMNSTTAIHVPVLMDWTVQCPVIH